MKFRTSLRVWHLTSLYAIQVSEKAAMLVRILSTQRKLMVQVSSLPSTLLALDPPAFGQLHV